MENFSATLLANFPQPSLSFPGPSQFILLSHPPALPYKLEALLSEAVSPVLRRLFQSCQPYLQGGTGSGLGSTNTFFKGLSEPQDGVSL